ncbi:Glucose-6-phosphate 1-dehydrogenase, partial [Coemansia javaensis]
MECARPGTGTLACGLDRAATENLPTTIVVFGASGDLAKKKTFPALFHLFQRGLLPQRLRIIGYARTQLSRDAFCQRATQHLSPETEQADIDAFLGVCSYVSGQYDVADDYVALRGAIDEQDREINPQGKSHRVRVYYMALPPTVFVDVATQIKANVYDGDCTNRVVIE